MNLGIYTFNIKRNASYLRLRIYLAPLGFLISVPFYALDYLVVLEKDVSISVRPIQYVHVNIPLEMLRYLIQRFLDIG